MEANGNIECPSTESMSTPAKLSKCFLSFLRFSLTKWAKIVFNTGTWQQLSHFRILQIRLQKKQERERKKKHSVVIVNSHWSCGSTKTAEDTDKTAKETLHLISLAQSLFTQISSLLYVKKNPKQNKTHFDFF